MQLTSIRWIAFDAVGTLIFPDPPVHLAYYRVGQKYGSRFAPAEVRTRFETAYAERAQGLWSSAAACEAGEREFWQSVVADVLPDVNDPQACFEELFAHFADPAAWQCFADVDETLGELAARGYRLAVASNFDARLHRICDGLPELGNITARIISSEVGAGKPRPAFFEAVLSTCECRVSELLMIGDDYENDVAGPRALGIAAWHLDRGSGGTSRNVTAPLAPPVQSTEDVDSQSTGGASGTLSGDCLHALSELVDRLPAAPGVG